MKVFIKILKIVLGIVLGLVFSFFTIVCLEFFFPKTHPLWEERLILWLLGPIIAGWLFLMLWLVLRKPSAKKIHTPGIELLPESASKLIDGIIDAMRYRRSVRADVRQELADHFTDALADCETEEEKQTVTKELIAEFGDIELLGKLLRRAKKRCRPLWRTIVARTFQLMGLCVVLLILYIGWFFTGKPQITTNYLEVMNQQVRPVADDSQNAWPFYKQAAEKRVKYEEKNEDEKFDFHPTSPSPFTRSEDDLQIIRKAIEDNKASLDLIRQGNQKPYYWRTYNTHKEEDTQMLAVLVPHLRDYKDLACLMCWEGLLSAEQNDFQKAFNDILECYSFGGHLRGQNTTVIEQLVAISIEGISRETLLMVLAEYGEQIDAQVLDLARKRLAGMIKNKDFTVSFGAEKLSMHDEAQRCFTKSRFGKSHLYFSRINLLGRPEILDSEIESIAGTTLHVLFTHPDKDQTLTEVERLYSEMEKLSKMTPASVRAEGLDMRELVEEAVKKNIFLNILMPALGQVNEIAWRGRAQARGALVILAVVQYEKEHSEFPESLDVLVDKGLLKEVPRDPFSDKPLVYRRTDDDFILYSVGLNFTDDGGELGTNKKGKTYSWRENGDGILWPVDR